MASLWQDLHYAIRGLLKSPGFASAAVLILALGIGVNTAIFSVLNAALLRPLPYHNANELAMFYFTNSQGEEVWFSTPAAYLDLRSQNGVFTDVAAWGNDTWPVNLTGSGEPERLQGLQVSANFFQVLGVATAQGRSFLPEEDFPGNNQVVVISHELWQRQFGGDLEMLGRSVLLNGAAYKIIGVMPADFRFILKTDVWTPLAFTTAQKKDGKNVYLHQVARLKSGVSTEQARAEVERLLGPYLNIQTAGLRANLKPLQVVLTAGERPMLSVLFAAAGFVLLIACVNIANLLLVRASARRKELAIRAALGAGRWRLVRQLLVESAVLAFGGGACGLLLASWGIRFLVNGLPESAVARNSHLAMLKLDAWALGYTFALTGLTTFVFGLLPALRASKVNLSDALKGGGPRTQRRGRNRSRSLLAVAEIALAMVLLTGAGLMIKSFWRLSHVNRGFEPAGVLTARIDPSGGKYHDSPQLTAFYQKLLERVSAIPGVQHAGITNGFLDQGWRIAIAERHAIPEAERALASRHPVSPDYFRAMGIPLVAGRCFTDQDVRGAQPVAIIDETLARSQFPAETPLGKHLQFQDALREIVGIVGATRAWKAYSFGGDEVFPHVYLPYQQDEPWPTTALIVRAQSGDPTRLIPAIRLGVAAIDKDQPIQSFKLLEESVTELSTDRRFSTQLLTAFAALAILLAALGIYAVMSYAVTQRTREIGVRMALGAQRGDIIKLVVGHGLLWILAGLAVGTSGALIVTRYIQTLLFDVRPTDPVIFVIVALMLGSVALLSCYLPARRATKVSPMLALRNE
jgi:putative ABC transport system permease protein